MSRRVLADPKAWGFVRRLVNIWLVAFLGLGPSTLSAATYYVSASTGLDSRTAAEAQSPTTPWRTLTHALVDPNDPNAPNPVLASGDVIRVAAGHYDSVYDPCDPNNAPETFPLPLIDGVTIQGAGGGSTSVVGTQGIPIFSHGGSLGPSTRVSGLALDAQYAPAIALLTNSTSDSVQAMIDRNTINVSSGAGVQVYDGNGGATLAPTIASNDLSVINGTGLAFFFNPNTKVSPAISNNTVTAGRGLTFQMFSAGKSARPAATALSIDPAEPLLVSNGTISPTVEGNRITGSSIGIAFSLNGAPGLATVAPVIRNNPKIQANGYGIRSFMSHTKTSGLTTVDPTISGNTISMNPFGDPGKAISLMSSVASGASGTLKITPTVTGNKITMGNGGGITARVSSYGNADINDSPTISSNTITGATLLGKDVIPETIALGANGVEVDLNGGGYGNLTSDVTIASNTISNVYGVGIVLHDSGIFGWNRADLGAAITGNKITVPHEQGILTLLENASGNGMLATSSVISGNTVSSPGLAGIGVTQNSVTENYGINQTTTVANNSVDKANGYGIWADFYENNYNAYDPNSPAGTFDFTVSGNSITGTTGIGSGKGLSIDDSSWYSSRVAKTILAQCNTVTGGAGSGFSLNLGGQSSLVSNDVRIQNNLITNNQGTGLRVGSNDYGSNPILITGNTITGNLGNGVTQESQNDPPADFGGGNLGSPGLNVITNNGSPSGTYDFYNNDFAPVFARNNYWGTTSPDPHIYDDNENGSKGAVDFTGALSSVPALVGLVSPVSVRGVATTGQLTWSPSPGATSYDVYLGPTLTGCSTKVGTVTTTSYSYSNLLPSTLYSWRIIAHSSSCPVESSDCAQFQTAAQCPSMPPSLIAPVEGATAVENPVSFEWSAVPGATSYNVWYIQDGGPATLLGNATGTSLASSVPAGPISWYVEAVGTNCVPVSSATGHFDAVGGCVKLPPPAISVVSEETTGEPYVLSWTPVEGANRYQVQEAMTDAFTSVTSQTVTGLSVMFEHELPTIDSPPQPFYYRVRAISACDNSVSDYSYTLRTVIVPKPDPTSKTPSATTEYGNTDPLFVFIDLCVDENGNIIVCEAPIGKSRIAVPKDGPSVSFLATSTSPAMTVTPSSGTITSAGQTFTVTVDPSNLNNGTHTGTVAVSSPTTPSNNAQVPVSVNLVTPVVPGGKSVSNDALIVPAVAHTPGINSNWRSDVRVTNIGQLLSSLQISYTPSQTNGTVQGMKTTISANPGETVALNDILKSWYGVGSANDSGFGVLDIRPAPTPGKKAQPKVSSATTLASSRTYDVTDAGTYGQFVPAIPYSRFIGHGTDSPVILSLQQIAQNAQFRTNVGLVEAAGEAATVRLKVFDDQGNQLDSFTQSLQPDEHIQLNQILASRGITLADGRIEVSVESGDGRIQAYASVVDNGTNDPTLVRAVNPADAVGTDWVVPGVADYTNSYNNWRTDARIWNASPDPQTLTLTFYPQFAPGSPMTKTLTINPNEVKVLNNILEDTYGVKNTGGAVDVSTTNPAAIVVTARTYDKKDIGTHGLFTPAVTTADAVGLDDRPLEVMQLEQSKQFRTNLGIAEVSGASATVQVTAIIPGALSAPMYTLSLAPHEFTQLVGVFKLLGLGDVYNARIEVKVIGGAGKVVSYGAVVDNQTQDPTYVPGQ